MTAGLVTVFALLAFVAISVWVFLIKKKEDFDEQANLPLDEEDERKNKEKAE